MRIEGVDLPRVEGGSIMSLTFITGNTDKAEELRRLLSIPIDHAKVDLDEIQSLDLNEVVKHKVQEAYERLGKPVLIEDTALVFKAMNKLPGPLIKWFLREIGNEGLCAILNPFPFRDATAISMFGYYDGSTLKIFESKIDGQIAKSPRGDTGFGWDAIFIPKGTEKTRAEMDMEEKDKFSMRRFALEKLKKYLIEKS